MGRFAQEVGIALRRARHARGLTLRQVAARTDERFKPTSVAGYERGERSISLERFCELCELYSVAPYAVLTDVWRSLHRPLEPDIDLSRLESLGSPEAALIGGFIRRIQALRRAQATGSSPLRAGDVEVLASGSGRTSSELIDALEPRTEWVGAEPEEPPDTPA
jgi:transcriptional regulator with XRE-family HTH domain